MGIVKYLAYYHLFGEIRVFQKLTGFNEERKFTGHLHDDETNLEYMEARYYNAKWGRFLQQDPVFLELGANPDLSKFLLDPQQLNAYAYARNNPLKYTDPTGKSIETQAQQLANGIAGQPYTGNSDQELQAYILGVSINAGAAAVETAGGIFLIGTGGGMAGGGVVACGTGVGCLVGAEAMTMGLAMAGVGYAFYQDGVKRLQKSASNAMQAKSSQAGQNSTKQASSSEIAQKIGNGHAWDKHGSGMFKNQDEFIKHIENVIENPDKSKILSNGRNAYAQFGSDGKSGTIVINNPEAIDGGTAYYTRNVLKELNRLK